MRAIGVTEFGGPEVLHDVEVPVQPLGPGQVRLRAKAVTVNPTDTELRAGTYVPYFPHLTFPWIPGMDVAGEVIELADGVDHLELGDEAMAIVVPFGAYREDIVLPGDSTGRVPAGQSLVASATLPMNGLTARRALDLMGLHSGQVLAVTGAAGAFGGYIIQLAKAEGLVVIADASDADTALVSGFGADIIVSRGADVAARFREAFPQGVDGLADGAIQGPLVLPAVKDGGVVTTLREYEGDGQRGLKVLPVQVSEMGLERSALDGLRQQVEDGVLTLRVAQVFPAEEAAAAHRLLQGGGVRGRIVLTF